METVTKQTNVVITPEELLKHWQGHRGLTRRVIEAFPEQEFFNFSIGGMRPFAGMVMELLRIAAPGLKQFVTGEIPPLSEQFEHDNKKENILKLWDEATEEINHWFSQIPAERFHEKVMSFGQYEGTICSSVFYFIDNEIHHRAQGYVFLRALNIEPPYFWDR